MDKQIYQESVLQLQYDFDNISSTIIPDVSGNGYTGVIRNHDASGALLQEEEIYGRSSKTIHLPGGVNGGYIELPHGVLANQEGLTISFWCKVLSHQEHQTLLSFGQDSQLYVKLVRAEEGAVQCIPCVTNSGQSQEQAVEAGVALALERWYQLCLTLQSKTPARISFYIDAILVGERIQNRVNSLDLSSEGSCLIGRGIYGADQANIALAEFQIFRRVLTKQEIKAMFCAGDESYIRSDRQYLEQKLARVVSDDLCLPVKGPYDSLFSYSSPEENVLSNNGKVHRPMPGEEDILVNLIVTITHNQTKEQHIYPIRVEALPCKEKLLKLEADALTLKGLNHVYSDILLPNKGSLGADISWESRNPSLLSPKGCINRSYLKQEKEKVDLIATIRYEEMEVTKMFEVIVLPVYRKKKVISVAEITISTVIGTTPVLPPRVWVDYEDGSREQELVCWEAAEKATSKTPVVEHVMPYSVTGRLKTDHEVVVIANILTKQEENQPMKRAKRLLPGQVRLLEDNILSQNAGRNLNYLHLLDADRMLYSFRLTFGRDTLNVEPLGGWDEPLGLLRGHSTGHFLSALAIAYGMTGDLDLKTKMDYMIHELRELQLLSSGAARVFCARGSREDAVQSKWSKNPSEWGVGYLGAYSPDQFALLEQFTTYPTIWAPYYTMHKILAGLLDCYEYGHNSEALKTASDLGLWVYDRLSGCSLQQRNRMWSMYIAGEYGGMNESLSKLYLLTGDTRYLEAAEFFDNTPVFEGLAENKDTITMLHANQHIPQIIGAMKEYETTGRIEYYRTGYYFWHLVTEHYSYSIGGVGRGENFKEPDHLAGDIESDRNCETCAAYNMLKLTHELYCYEPDCPEYFDYYERTLLNHIVASQNPMVTEDMHHGVTYMLPIAPGQHKEYGRDYDEFTCCHGTGMENHVKYAESIYYTDITSDTLYVNLYLPSELHWMEKGITLRQHGNFPGERMTFQLEGRAEISIALRIPNWCREEFRLLLNGQEITADGSDGGYLSLSRAWETEDILEVLMPYKIKLEYTPDDLELPVASVIYGPFVMVAENSSKEWITLTLAPDIDKEFKLEWKDNLPVLYYEDLKFVPIYEAHHIDYHTYFKINIPY